MIVYLSTIPVSVPTPMIIASVTGTVYGGIPLNLSCDYTLSISVDTDITTSATWTINNTDISDDDDDDDDDDSISSDGVNLIFSPPTTTYTGKYTCTLIITPSSQTPHVTVQEPVESSEKNIIVQSKVHSILHVIVYYMISLSLSLSLSPSLSLSQSLSLMLLSISVPLVHYMLVLVSLSHVLYGIRSCC